MTDIGGGWYMGKSDRGLPPLKITKLSKKGTVNVGCNSKETI